MPRLDDESARPVRPLARVAPINPKDVIGSDAAVQQLLDRTAAPAVVATSQPGPPADPAPGEEQRFLYDGDSKGGKTLVGMGEVRYGMLVDSAAHFGVDQSVLLRYAFDAWLAVVGNQHIPPKVDSPEDAQALAAQLVALSQKWRQDAEAAEEDREANRRRAQRNYRSR